MQAYSAVRAERILLLWPTLECFCLSRMTSEISHGSLHTARFRTRLFIAQIVGAFQDNFSFLFPRPKFKVIELFISILQMVIHGT